MDELRVASKGGIADYYGITYEKVEATGGVFWPCPTLDHPGTPRLFEGGRFYHPDGKARFNAVEWRPPAEPPDDEFPLRLTTGRTVAHFLSGNQTRRLPGLVEQTPAALGRGPPVARLRRRRPGAGGHPARAPSPTRPWSPRRSGPTRCSSPTTGPGRSAANLLTIDALDPISKMPEYKVCACRVERGQAVDPVPAPPMPPGQRPVPARDRPARRPAARRPRRREGGPPNA